MLKMHEAMQQNMICVQAHILHQTEMLPVFECFTYTRTYKRLH